MIKPQLTEAEFDALKQRRDEALNVVIREVTIKLGGDPDHPHAHISYGGGTHDCYCACPDGPCQHDWRGPDQAILDDDDEPCGFERTCVSCAMGAMSHDLRVMP